jgi:DNA end-binding protein Ku
MKPIWTGNIQFGQKKIGFTLRPVAAADRPVRLRIVHACGQRIRQPRSCPDCGDVSAADVHNAYESATGQLHSISKKQLEACKPASRRSLAIEHFASLSEVAHLPKRAVYFMEPSCAEQHDYQLLYASLAQTGKCAVTRIVMRGSRTEQLAIIRPWERVLFLQTLFYEHELQAPPDPLDLTQLKPDELAASSRIVAAGTRRFDHSLYTDRFREALNEMFPKAGLADTHLAPEITSATLLPEPREAPGKAPAVHCEEFAGEEQPPMKLHVHIAAMVRGSELTNEKLLIAPC